MARIKNLSAPAQVGVNTTSTQILASSKLRSYLLIVNDSDAVIYLAFGADAELNKGIRLNPNGGSYEMDDRGVSRQTVNGIHGGVGAKYVTVQEAKY